MNDLVEFTENRVDLGALYDKSNIGETLASLDQDLVGLKPVKTRIREIAALLIVEWTLNTFDLGIGHLVVNSWGSAIFGAIVLSLVSSLVNFFTSPLREPV